MGLFAARDINRGDHIADYTGDELVLTHDGVGGPYALAMTRRGAIDAARTNTGYGRWANDPRGGDAGPNSEFVLNLARRTGRLRATRNIAKGDEILVSYRAGILASIWPRRQAGRSTGRSPSAFSRGFRRHTGMALVQYVNRLRINLACQHLMNQADRPITDICYDAGFNNLSNFNRQFLAQKGMPPSRFRALLAENARSAEARAA